MKVKEDDSIETSEAEPLGRIVEMVAAVAECQGGDTEPVGRCQGTGLH